MTDELPDRLRLTAKQRERLRAPYAQVGAAYFKFDRTGEPAVDAFLSAVALAGSSWPDAKAWVHADIPVKYNFGPFLADREQSPADVIEAAAREAAAEIADLRERIGGPEQPGEDGVTRETYRKAYLDWRDEGIRMRRVLKDIWHYATPGDTSHMTFGNDPGVVLDAAKEHLVPAAELADLRERVENAKSAFDWFRHPTVVGTGNFDAAEKVRWELDGQPDGASDE